MDKIKDNLYINSKLLKKHNVGSISALCGFYNQVNICECGKITYHFHKCACKNEYRKLSNRTDNRAFIKFFNTNFEYKEKDGKHDVLVNALFLEYNAKADSENRYKIIEKKTSYLTVCQSTMEAYNLPFNEFKEVLEFLVNKTKLTDKKVHDCLANILLISSYLQETKSQGFEKKQKNTLKCQEIYSKIYEGKLKNLYTEENLIKYPILPQLDINCDIVCDGMDDFLKKRNFPLEFKDSLMLMEDDFMPKLNLFDFFNETNVEKVKKLDNSILTALKHKLASKNFQVFDMDYLLNFNNSYKKIPIESVAHFLVKAEVGGTNRAFYKNVLELFEKNETAVIEDLYAIKNIENYLRTKNYHETRIIAFLDTFDINPLMALKILLTKESIKDEEVISLYKENNLNDFFIVYPEEKTDTISNKAMDMLKNLTNDEYTIKVFKRYYEIIIEEDNEIQDQLFCDLIEVFTQIKKDFPNIDEIKLLSYLIKQTLVYGYNSKILQKNPITFSRKFSIFLLELKKIFGTNIPFDIFVDDLPAKTKIAIISQRINPEIKKVFDEKVIHFKELERETKNYSLIAPTSCIDMLMKSFELNFVATLLIKYTVHENKKIMFLKDKSKNKIISIFIYEENLSLYENIDFEDSTNGIYEMFA